MVISEKTLVSLLSLSSLYMCPIDPNHFIEPLISIIIVNRRNLFCSSMKVSDLKRLHASFSCDGETNVYPFVSRGYIFRLPIHYKNEVIFSRLTESYDTCFIDLSRADIFLLLII